MASPLVYLKSKNQSRIPPLYIQNRVEKRQITTSKSWGLASSFKLQSSLASALVQDEVDLTSYPFQYPTRNPRNPSPRVRTIPRDFPSKEQVAGIPKEMTETLRSELRFGPEEPYWQKIPRWSDVEREDFIRYSWQVS